MLGVLDGGCEAASFAKKEAGQSMSCNEGG